MKSLRVEALVQAFRRRPRRGVLAMTLLLGLLWVPEGSAPMPPLPDGTAFLWDANERFEQLEKRFVAAREAPCPAQFPSRLSSLRLRVQELQGDIEPNDPLLEHLETDFFETVALAGACPEHLGALSALRSELRTRAKALFVRWSATREARDRAYRLLYGTRTAIEELMLQVPAGFGHDLSLGLNEPSDAPAVTVSGVQLRSGDLLLSRGGAPTSAFIARGNDYPGSFSHVSVLHVDEKTGEASVVESHIESGVGVSSVAQYLEDKKLRILVLRLRSDLPHVMEQPLLAHLAAKRALDSATGGHVPYDFAMDTSDSSKQFCSEVASANYAHYGIVLWQAASRFSAPGLARWMSALGVEHLETHAPSDLEYDPHLRVVAEWHPVQSLFDEHVDNVVIDAMLERAEQGAAFDYPLWSLPLARFAKGYSWVLNLFGVVGPVPEGMSATVALRAQWLIGRHELLKSTVLEKSRVFQEQHGYRPPYWRLFSFAREAAANVEWEGD